jgi:hypothetical protein
MPAEADQRGLQLAGQGQSRGDEAFFDEVRDAAADEVAHHVLGQGVEPLPGEHRVHRRGKIRGGVEQRAVQVEEDGFGGAA